MARKPEVTRTLTTTTVTFKAAILSEDKLVSRTLTLPRKYKNDNDIIKALSAVLPADVKPLAVIGTEIGSALYGMSESDFIKYAHILPDRGPADSTETADEN